MKKFSIVLLIVLFSIPNMASAFNDVSYDHPNYDAIRYAQNNGIVEGYEDGIFRPEQEINRAEMIKIVIEYTVDDAEITGSNCFNDVQDDWYAKYVCTAKDKGVVVGYPDGNFRPEQTINFVEASKLIVKGFEYNTEEDQDIWYRPYVRYLSNKRTIPQTIEHLDSVLIRGELAEILYRVHINTQDPDDELSENFPTMAYYDGGDLRTLLDYGYAVDAEYVYYAGRVLESADPSTFEVIANESYWYGRDVNGVYRYESLVEGVDSQSFELVGDSRMIKDSTNVYYWGFNHESLNILEGADPATIESLVMQYFKDTNHIYYSFWGDEYIQVDGDAATFEMISKAYARDKDYVYQAYNYHAVVEGADPNSFQVLDNGYTKDDYSAFYGNTIINGSDAASFEYFKNSYSKDKDNVYYMIDVFEGADSTTFEYLAFDYSKDANFVYIDREIFIGADPESFHVIFNAGYDDVYSHDKNNVYFNKTIIQGADPATFIYIGESDEGDTYSADINHTYKNRQIWDGEIPLPEWEYLQDRFLLN